MKNKFLLIRIIIGVLVIILSILTFLGIGNSKIMMPSILMLLGLLQLFNGLYFLSRSGERKGYGLFLIASGIIIFCIAVAIMVIMLK